MNIKYPALVILTIILITTSVEVIPYFTSPQYMKKTYTETVEDVKKQLSISTKEIERLDTNGILLEISYFKSNREIAKDRYENGLLIEKNYYDKNTLIAVEKFGINNNLIKREYYYKDKIFAIDYFEGGKLTITEYYDEGNLIETKIIFIPPSVINRVY